MIILSTSRSFERHVERCLADLRPCFARTTRGLPRLKEGGPGLCLYHVGSFPEPLDQALVKCLSGHNLVLGVASDEPSVKEFLALSEFGLKAYINSYMADLHYRQMLQVVAAGQSWVVPPILDQALSVARSGAEHEPELLRPLTAREREVALGVARGLSNPEIGQQLGIQEPTVKVHLGRVFKKLGIRNRYALALRLQSYQQAS